MSTFEITRYGPLPIMEIENASQEMHQFLRTLVTCNWMDDPRYKVSRASGAFLQGGSNLTEGWIMVEFWRPEGVDAFLEYANYAWAKLQGEAA